MNDLEKSIIAILHTIPVHLQENSIYEISFTQFFGRDYLDTFDEKTYDLEGMIVRFCKKRKIHLIKTRVSYIFSLTPLNFKRKSDEELA